MRQRSNGTTVPAGVIQRPTTVAGEQPLDRMMWEIGRAYYAYVGLAERILSEAGLEEHIRPGMGLVLFSLYEQDKRTIKEIAARSQLACSTLTGVLDRMEKSGLIQRSRDPQDARLVRVALTSFARRLEKKCRSMTQHMSDVIQSGLGESGVAQTQQLLRRLTETLRAEDERMALSQPNKSQPVEKCRSQT